MGEIDIIHKIAAYAGLEPKLLDREIVQIIKDIIAQYPYQRYEWYGMELKARLSPIIAHALRKSDETKT